MKQYSRVCAYIDLDAIEENINQMEANIAARTKMIAVIKTDGYGHGAVPIGRMLEERDCVWGFATATAEEAFLLRAHGLKKPILILGYVFEEYYKELIQQEVRFTVYRKDMAEAISKAGTECGKTAYIHVKMDTGMSRLGFPDREESLETIQEISKLPNIEVEGIFTHFAKADELDKTSANLQLKRFNDFYQALTLQGLVIPYPHCSNSAGIIEIPKANQMLVRPGITIYGLWPSNEVSKDRIQLSPAMTLKSHVVHVKEIPAGTGVSYGSTFVASEPTTVATIPVGYGDGYPRSLSNKGFVLIRGKRVPILGRVCMDQMMVDVTGLGVEMLDPVTLIGRDGEECITMEELGELSGRFNYEFACDIGKRIPRSYLRDGVVVEQIDFFDR